MKTTIKSVSVAVAAAILLSACAAPSQPYLDHARTACAVGDQYQCSSIPPLESAVNSEHQEQAGKIASGIFEVLGAIILGAAAVAVAAAPPPTHYYPVVTCTGWNCP